MDVRGTSALILYGAIVVAEVSKYSLFEHCLDNSVDKGMKILYNGKGILKHYFQAVRRRVPLRQKTFGVNLLSRIV